MTKNAERRRRWLVFGLIAIVIVVADQVSKLFIDANFGVASVHPSTGPQPTQIIGEFVRIAKSYNTGGIFGLFGNTAAVLALSSTIVIALLIVYQWREGAQSWPLTVALGLLLGGAIGNFIDRVRLGAVIDFVDMGIGDARFYTFNVADSAISTALLLLILIAIFGERLTRRFEQRAAH